MTETVFMNKIAAFIFWHRHIGQTINRSRLIFILDALSVKYKEIEKDVIRVSYTEANEQKSSIFHTDKDTGVDLAQQLKELLCDDMIGLLQLEMKEDDTEWVCSK